MDVAKKNNITKEEIIKTIQEDIENDGPISDILYKHFYPRVIYGKLSPYIGDERKILGFVPISCQKECEKFEQFKPCSRGFV